MEDYFYKGKTTFKGTVRARIMRSYGVEIQAIQLGLHRRIYYELFVFEATVGPMVKKTSLILSSLLFNWREAFMIRGKRVLVLLECGAIKPQTPETL